MPPIASVQPAVPRGRLPATTQARLTIAGVRLLSSSLYLHSYPAIRQAGSPASLCRLYCHWQRTSSDRAKGMRLRATIPGLADPSLGTPPMLPSLHLRDQAERVGLDTNIPGLSPRLPLDERPVFRIYSRHGRAGEAIPESVMAGCLGVIRIPAGPPVAHQPPCRLRRIRLLVDFGESAGLCQPELNEFPGLRDNVPHALPGNSVLV